MTLCYKLYIVTLIIDFQTREQRYIPGNYEIEDLEYALQGCMTEIARLEKDISDLMYCEAPNIVHIDQKCRMGRATVMRAHLHSMQDRLTALELQLGKKADDYHESALGTPIEYW